MDLSIPNLMTVIDEIVEPLATDVIVEIQKRLKPLMEIGLGYLTLGRGMNSVSGGEAQRIKVSKYLNSALTDVAYVLDEPSSGLHPHDISRMENVIKGLRDKGNTVLMVEHNHDLIRLSDNIIEMGPDSGAFGGEIVFQGDYQTIVKGETYTGIQLRERKEMSQATKVYDEYYHFSDVGLNNLKNISVKLPVGGLTVIAGVAGSGKSSLLKHMIDYTSVESVVVEQKGIGVNSRSTPATYLDISDYIRDKFAVTHKVSKSLFSFNSKGACPNCKGKGIISTEMGFMNTIESVCDVCHGKRYSGQALSYNYMGKNIAEIYELSVDEAFMFFEDKNIKDKLARLQSVGLGYLHLNQSMTTLSGGELQRVKLANRLKSKGAIYFIDEPSDGLHNKDLETLIRLFRKLIKAGNTVVIVDHNMNLVKEADYLIELGPEGGAEGGYLLFEGRPVDLLLSKESITKNYL